MHHKHALCPQKQEECVRSPETVVTHCDPPHGCWVLNLSPLETQPMPLPMSHFSSPQPQLSYTTPDHLPRGGTSHDGLSSSMSIIN